jgi:membrane AbrB-like protein
MGMILLMIALSGGIAVLLHIGAGIDPLTAYLATSPGGMDSLAIIAAASGADMGFVMAIQTSRLVIVLITGPPLARLATRHIRKKTGHPADGKPLL